MLTLRKATTNDCQLINQMATIAFPATYRDMLSAQQIDYMLQWMYAPENTLKYMEVDHHVYFIGYKETEPCGYISVVQEEEDIFHLQKIYVLPQFQGQRIGLFLFQAAVNYIKEIHPSPCLMELNVNHDNIKAIEFYRRMGMRKLREGDFHIGHGYYMTDYIMGLDIV